MPPRQLHPPAKTPAAVKIANEGAVQSKNARVQRTQEVSSAHCNGRLPPARSKPAQVMWSAVWSDAWGNARPLNEHKLLKMISH